MKPAQHGGERDMADIHLGLSVQISLKPVIGGHQLLAIAIAKGRITECLGPPDGFPAKGDTGIGQSLCDCLHPERFPTRLALLGNKPPAAMKRIEICADHIGIEQGIAVVTKQYGHFPQRIFSKNNVVADHRACFLMDDLDRADETSFMSEHQGLAGIGRVGLVKQLHFFLSSNLVARISRIARKAAKDDGEGGGQGFHHRQVQKLIWGMRIGAGPEYAGYKKLGGGKPCAEHR